MHGESQYVRSRGGDSSKASAMLSGTNNVPLGSRRTNSDGASLGQEHPPNQDRASFRGVGEDREELGASHERRVDTNGAGGPIYPVDHKRSERTQEKSRGNSGESGPRATRRRSRWGKDSQRSTLPIITTILPSSIPIEQMEMYVMQARLEEINQKLRSGAYVPQGMDRSPSPEPVYGADGKRVNTREYRYRKKLEQERHKIVDVCMRIIPNFKPPLDYKKPTKVSDKIYIPVKDYPEINFIGQLIGPRGTTLKRIENDSGAKISIRGKGSVKEGKSRADGALIPGEEEDLHCLITADSEDKVHKAMKAIEKVIETAASVPEGQNELKRMQLRYLAELNGTLRDDENQICSNCGAVGHRRSDCPEQKNITVNLVCRICNSAGHTARDCMQKSNTEVMKEAAQRDKRLDSEYANLMAELGEFGYDSSDPNNPSTYNKSSSSQLPWGKRPPWETAAAPTPDQSRDPALVSQWLPRTDAPAAPDGTVPQMIQNPWIQFAAEGDQSAYKNVYSSQAVQPQGWELQDTMAPPGYPSITDASAYSVQPGFPTGDAPVATTYPQNAWSMMALSMMQPQYQAMVYGSAPPPPPTWAPPPPPPPSDAPIISSDPTPGST